MAVGVALGALAIVIGTGMWLVLNGFRNLSRRAKQLGLWPDRRDEPQAPWSIYHEWTLALIGDLVGGSDQSDAEYGRYRRRVQFGVALLVVGFGSAFAVTRVM